ncbi:MAG: hypothetical protein IJ125_05430 [Atopobiaceae bacterium]|nr:hypothetical protein [Atopobiaceae bacterium]
MKITGLNPTILTSDLESMRRLFEDLGFERRHERENISSEFDNSAVDTSIRMKSEDGFTVDINSFEGIPRDETLIRINVDDFDEAYQFLEEHGFRNFMGEGNLLVTPFLKGAHMESPSGFGIMLMQHLKS